MWIVFLPEKFFLSNLFTRGFVEQNTHCVTIYPSHLSNITRFIAILSHGDYRFFFLFIFFVLFGKFYTSSTEFWAWIFRMMLRKSHLIQKHRSEGSWKKNYSIFNVRAWISINAKLFFRLIFYTHFKSTQHNIRVVPISLLSNFGLRICTLDKQLLQITNFEHVQLLYINVFSLFGVARRDIFLFFFCWAFLVHTFIPFLSSMVFVTLSIAIFYHFDL